MTIRERTIVVGAGFAGLIAARELSAAGHDVVVLEARDRIGGRTWTDDRMGLRLEMGGTWVHWQQGFVWAEIVRYGQEIVQSPTPADGIWITAGERRSGSSDELDARIAPPQEAMFADAARLFPLPHDPNLHLRPGADPADRQALVDCDNARLFDDLRLAGFDQEALDLMDAYWAAGYNGHTATASPTMVRHWAALADGRLELLDDMTLRYKLKDGTAGIYERIAEDFGGPIRLSTPVTRIEHDDFGARVTMLDDEVLSADAVIVTVPITALRRIAFAPALPPGARSLVNTGLNSTGLKVWIAIRGRHSFQAYAPTPSPLAFSRVESYDEASDTSLLVAFGPDSRALDINDPVAVQRVLEQWIPGVEVVDCCGHDWAQDGWSQETWATFRRGQVTGGWQDFLTPTSRLVFAGADYALGWNSFIDGAIESGLRAARTVRSFYGEGASWTPASRERTAVGPQRSFAVPLS